MNENAINPAIRMGTLMHGLALVILLATTAWGAWLYPSLPDTLPIHWNAAGEADDFRSKSIGWAFGSLFVAWSLVVGLLVLHRLMDRRNLTVPSEREAYSLVFGYLNLSMALLFSWISLMTWYGLSAGPWLIAFSLMSAVPVLIIIGFYMNRITDERKALAGPVEPSLDPKYWVLGGMFYSNADDPRTMVPRPTHMGIGTTFNLATAGGKLMVALLILILVGTILLPILL